MYMYNIGLQEASGGVAGEKTLCGMQTTRLVGSSGCRHITRSPACPTPRGQRDTPSHEGRTVGGGRCASGLYGDGEIRVRFVREGGNSRPVCRGGEEGRVRLVRGAGRDLGLARGRLGLENHEVHEREPLHTRRAVRRGFLSNTCEEPGGVFRWKLVFRFFQETRFPVSSFSRFADFVVGGAVDAARRAGAGAGGGPRGRRGGR
jgi:hypothetical protein